MKCPSNGCNYETESKVGLSIHWGRSDDNSHPGKLKENYDIDTSRSEEFKDKVSSGQKQRWKNTPAEEKDRIIEKVAQKNRGRSLTKSHKEKLSQALSGEDNPMYGKEMPESTKEKISKSLKSWFSKNGTDHCSVNFDEETRQKISNSVKKHWNSLSKNKKKSICDKRADSMKKTWSSRSEKERKEWGKRVSEGMIKAGVGGSEYNTYEVDGLNHVVRSSWEKRIAFILQDIGINYEYEPKYKLKNQYYKPDFETEDGVVIEVKGFGGEKSVNKAKEFMATYKDKKYIVIGDDIPSHSRIEYSSTKQIKEFLMKEIKS